MTTLVFATIYDAYLSWCIENLVSKHSGLKFKYVCQPQELEGYHPPFGIVYLYNWQMHPAWKDQQFRDIYHRLMLTATSLSSMNPANAELLRIFEAIKVAVPQSQTPVVQPTASPPKSAQ